MEANRECLAYLAAEYGIAFDDVDLSQFPETLTAEFSPETIASLAAIINEQSFALDEVRRSRGGKLAKTVNKLLGWPLASDFRRLAGALAEEPAEPARQTGR